VVKVNGGYTGQCTTLVVPAKIDGGAVGQCTSMVNEVKVVSSDTINALVLDKGGFSLTSSYMTKADSSLYMRTDWANIKNPTASVDLANTNISWCNEVGLATLNPGQFTKIADTTGAKIKLDSLVYQAKTVKVNGGDVGKCTTLVNPSPVDSASLARSVWNNSIISQSQRRIQYTDSLGEEITASVDTSQIKTMNDNNHWGASYTWNYQTRTLTSGAGSGANSVVIRCKESSTLTPIAFAQIQILDSTQSSTIGLLTSDSQGRGFFALNNGYYCVRLYEPGWQFTVPETLKVDGNEDTTYYADAFDPGLPPQASLCRVYGWIYDINNHPVVEAKIQASIKITPLRYQDIIISPYYKTTTTDDEGYWYLDLYPNSALNPSDTKYIFFIYTPSGTILKIETTLPNQASWELQW
jgi:hypothetical protein